MQAIMYSSICEMHCSLPADTQHQLVNVDPFPSHGGENLAFNGSDLIVVLLVLLGVPSMSMSLLCLLVLSLLLLLLLLLHPLLLLIALGAF